MTTALKFILGDEGLLKSRVRKSAEDHEPVIPKKICRECMRKGRKMNCRYCTHRSLPKLWREKNAKPGELYMGD